MRAEMTPPRVTGLEGPYRTVSDLSPGFSENFDTVPVGLNFAPCTERDGNSLLHTSNHNVQQSIRSRDPKSMQYIMRRRESVRNSDVGLHEFPSQSHAISRLPL